MQIMLLTRSGTVRRSGRCVNIVVKRIPFTEPIHLKLVLNKSTSRALLTPDPLQRSILRKRRLLGLFSVVLAANLPL
jgi:hypothetical protein